MTDRNESPRDIESRIQGTQEELKSDIDALEDKMAPDHLKEQARQRLDEAKEQAKERAVETTRQAGDAVRHKIDDAGEAVRDRIEDVGERFGNRDGGMPSLSLLGLAAVIGIGLLLVRGSRNRHDEGHYTRHPNSDYVGSSDLPPAHRSNYR